MSPQMDPKWRQNRLCIQLRVPLCFPFFLAPQMESEPFKTAVLFKGSKQFHKSFLFLLRILLAPTSFPKQSRKHSNTNPKRVPETHRNSTQHFIDFASDMTPKWDLKVSTNRPGSTAGPHGTQGGTKESSGPSHPDSNLSLSIYIYSLYIYK